MNIDTQKKRTTIEVVAGTIIKQRELDKCLKEQLVERGGVPSTLHIKFDWSKAQFADLATLIWFLVLLDQLKRQEYDISLRLPDPKQNYRFWSFLLRWHFFEVLKCVDHPANILPGSQLCWLEMNPKYTTSSVIDEDGNLQQALTLRLLEISSFKIKADRTSELYVDEDFDPYIELWKKIIILQALGNWCGWSVQDAQKFVSKTVIEFLQNAKHHSSCSWVLSGFNVDNKNLMLAVSDNGNGIPEVLRNILGQNTELKTKIQNMSDAQLIKYFTEPSMILDSELIRLSTRGVISTQGEQPGRGLYYCKKLILEKGGELRIRSGSGCVVFSPDGREKSSDGLFKSAGTTIRVIIPRKA